MPAIVIGFVLSLLGLGLIAAVLRYRRRKTRDAAIVAVVVGVALVTAGAAVGYALYQSYVTDASWSFWYSLSVQGNGTFPASLVVAVPADESLLAGLHLTSGNANWSLLDTVHGRGLFVRFAGSARIETSVSVFPPPAPLPDTSPTLMASTNCTSQPANCTGPAMVWTYYSGPPGASFGFVSSSWYLRGDLIAGWALYYDEPPPVPMA